MRRIEIDDEVYAWLESKAKGFRQPNDVLRTELLGSVDGHTEDRSTKGRLWPLLEAGLLKAGDELHHDQPRKARTHRAVVEADGYIKPKRDSTSTHHAHLLI